MDMDISVFNWEFCSGFRPGPLAAPKPASRAANRPTAGQSDVRPPGRPRAMLTSFPGAQCMKFSKEGTKEGTACAGALGERGSDPSHAWIDYHAGPNP